MNDLDAVRKRPGMYVGETTDGTGLHNMLYEVVNNAINEALAGHCDRIDVTLNAGGSVTVRDNGRGIPTSVVREYGVSAVEVVMTRLSHRVMPHRNAEETQDWLIGVGVVVVNALSDMLEVRVWRDANESFVRFRKGVPEAPLAVVGSADGASGQRRRGTEITFHPDPAFFAKQNFDFVRIECRLRELSHLKCGATILLFDKRDGEELKEVVIRL